MGMMIMRHPFFFRPEDCGTRMPLSAAHSNGARLSFRVIWITCPLKGWSFMDEWQRETGRDATFQEESFRLAVTKARLSHVVRRLSASPEIVGMLNGRGDGQVQFNQII